MPLKEAYVLAYDPTARREGLLPRPTPPRRKCRDVTIATSNIVMVLRGYLRYVPGTGFR
jgi:hypothetical protein